MYITIFVVPLIYVWLLLWMLYPLGNTIVLIAEVLSHHLIDVKSRYIPTIYVLYSCTSLSENVVNAY